MRFPQRLSHCGSNFPLTTSIGVHFSMCFSRLSASTKPSLCDCPWASECRRFAQTPHTCTTTLQVTRRLEGRREGGGRGEEGEGRGEGGTPGHPPGNRRTPVKRTCLISLTHAASPRPRTKRNAFPVGRTPFRFDLTSQPPTCSKSLPRLAFKGLVNSLADGVPIPATIGRPNRLSPTSVVLV